MKALITNRGYKAFKKLQRSSLRMSGKIMVDVAPEGLFRVGRLNSFAKISDSLKKIWLGTRNRVFSA